MKISIITVCYNSEKTIGDAIKSVINQNYQNLEYIIIDGASTDNTINIIKEYQKKFPIILVSEKDKGIYDALNKGFNLATGDIFTWLDSDNYFESKILEDINAIFSNDSNLDIAYGNIEMIDKNGSLLYIHKPLPNVSFRTVSAEGAGGIPLQPGVFFKKNIYKNAEGFNISYKIASDVDFWFKILEKKPSINYCDKIFGYYRLEKGGASQSLSGIFNGLKEVIKIGKQYKQPVTSKLRIIKHYFGGYINTILKK